MSKSAEKAAEDLQATLAGISTKDLVDELATREGVKELVSHPEETYKVEVIWVKPNPPAGGTHLPVTLFTEGKGSARILVVID